MFGTFVSSIKLSSNADPLIYLSIALGYWAVETIDGEPYLAKISWKSVIPFIFQKQSSLTSKISYFLKAIDWARKYGLRILIDFHSLPGKSDTFLKPFTQLTLV